ncbi:MAG: hypothetical protein HY055_04410 [Magnetospirillum sp.]|nr:hypothetical protein [Magnetospirillum sp.]
MSRLLAEWKERKGREDDVLHEQLCAAIRAGQVQVFTDPRLLDFQGSPVHQHWDHLLPLTILMTLALVILLASGVLIGIVVMTLCVFAHLFGNKYYVGWRLKTRALSYILGSNAQFQALWQLGGVALVVKGVNEAPCLAPKGDWRKFIRRNLGEGKPPPQEQLTNAPVPAGPRMTAPPPPPPAPPPQVIEDSPLSDSLQPAAAPAAPVSVLPDPVPSEPVLPEAEPVPENEIMMAPPASPKPGDRWASINDEEPPHDEVVPRQ